MLAEIGTFIGVVNSILGGQKAKKVGRAAQEAKEFEARQLDQQAGQVVAVAQREAMDEKRRAELIASRALALTAAGGGGAADPTAVNLIGDISNEGAYRQAVALYQGEEQARQLNLAAKMARHEGEVVRRGGESQQQASTWQAASYLAQGGSSLYSRYARTPPPTNIDTGAGTGAAGLAVGARMY